MMPFKTSYVALYKKIGLPLNESDRLARSVVQEAALRLSIVCPESLAEYYEVAGREKTLNAAINRLLTPEHWFLDDQRLVFMEENQNSYVWATELNGAADPAVFQGSFNKSELRYEWHREHDCCSEFLKVMLVYQAVCGGMPFLDRRSVDSSTAELMMQSGWCDVGRVRGQLALVRNGQCAFIAMIRGTPCALIGAMTESGLNSVRTELASGSN